MEIIPLGPLPVASLLWQPGPRAFALTVVCKATFPLAPGEATLAATQEPPCANDAYWSNDAGRSLSAPNDLAPLKVRADVILVGSAYAPRGEPVRSLVARLKIGEIDKSIEVFADRSISPDGAPMEGPRFARMPLWWERAAGGSGTMNPVGMRVDHKDAHGRTAIANLRPVGPPVLRQGMPFPPVGFGPIAPSWPSRRELLGLRAGSWPTPRWMDEPLPSDIDPGFFNAAPRDQQVEVIRDNETLFLENLHPQHPQLVMTLSGLRPRARVERPGAPEEDVALRADTLFIDTDRGLCTVTWRGPVRLDHPGDPGRITIDIVSPRKVMKPGDGLHTLMPSNTDATPLPFMAAPPEQSPMARPSASEPRPLTGLLALAAMSPVGPFDGSGTVAQTILPQLVQSPVTPFGGGPAAPVVPPPPPSRPQESMSPREALWGTSSALMRSPMIPSEPQKPPSVQSGGVLAASDIAAAIERPAAAPRSEPEPEDEPTPVPVSEPRAKAAPSEGVKLVWLDTAVIPRIRRQAEWRLILTDLELRLIDEAEADLAAGPLDPEAKDRRTVREVLLRGAALTGDGVKQAVDGALGEDGGFDPPLVLIAAELEMPFDEIETMKAVATAARPLGSTDKRLKEALDLVDELLASQWLSGSGGTAESLTSKVREAFAQARRTLSPDYLDVQAERRLVEQRAYQSRPIFGKKHLRGIVPSAAGPIPVYLPEDMKDELPMFRRFKVKMLAELHHREDQGEASAWAIKALALGRVLSPGS